tara:strand:- start:1012 stop:2868 length:1857 start_codon:yes stop_codon:yes gene_type:complete
MEVFRLQNPIIGAGVHALRLKALLIFICWLSQYRIRSFSSVNRTHIDEFSKKIAFGSELALGIPEKVFSFLKDSVLAGRELPRKRDKSLRRRKVFELAGVSGLPTRPSQYSGQIISWFETQIAKNFNGTDLQNMSYEDVLEEMDFNPCLVTSQDVHRKLVPLEEIWSWQHHFTGHCFSESPFLTTSSKVANSLGTVPNRTKTIPPKLAFSMMSESATWVLNYGDEILNLYAKNADAKTASKRLTSKGLDVKLANGFGKYRDVFTLESLLRSVSAACFAVIASLTARRKEEIFDLGYKCIDEDRGDGAYWLTIYIEKTLQRYDLCPVPLLVKKAVSLLEKLSETARCRSGTDSIWQYVSDTGEIIKLDDQKVRASLQYFYFYHVPSEEEKDWNFSFHQYRRIFALLYYYRFDGAYIGALSHHLRHFNIEMTKRYITDEKFLKEMRDIGETWTASFLRDAVNGKRKVGGKSGDKIKRKFEDWSKHFNKKVDVYERERIVEKMVRYMRRVGAEFKQQVWGTICTCPKKTGLAKLAGCANKDGKPDISKGSIEKCGGCPFSIYTDRFPDAVADEIKTRKKSVNSAPQDSVLAEVQTLKIVSLQGFLSKSESISPFEQEAQCE